MGENKSETLYFDLNPGAKIPSVGLGTWKAEPGLVSQAVIAAAKVHSPYKLWCSDCSPEDISKALSKTLEDLQLDYINLYTAISYKARLSRFHSGSHGFIVPSRDLECNGGPVRIWSGARSRGVWVKGEVLKDPVLNEIAEKLNKSTAQVCHCWGIQSAHGVLPKSVNESRIKENLSLFDWSIPPELFSKISGLNQQRLLQGDFVVHESLSPYKSVEELWDGEI